MKNRKEVKKKTLNRDKGARGVSGREALRFYTEMSQLKRKIDKLTDNTEDMAMRMEDAEIHINLLTRFITTICVEKIGMRVGVLKRLLKRVEREAVRDSQILHLESLYNLPLEPPLHKKKHLPRFFPKKDPWDDIS